MSFARILPLLLLLILAAAPAQAQCAGRDAENTVNTFSRQISAMKSTISDIASTAKKAASAKSEEEGTRLQENLQKLKDQARELMTKITAEADRIEAQINTDLVTFQHDTAARTKLREELKRLTKLRQNAVEQYEKIKV